jgi:hypothetical protein
MTRSRYSSLVEVSDRRQFFAAYDSGSAYERPSRVAGSAVVVIALAVLVVAIFAGIQLRMMLWNRSTDLRTPDDAVQSFATGLDVVRQAKLHAGEDPASSGPASWRDLLPAYLGYYHHVAEQAKDGQFAMDYPPLRLAIVTAWANVARMQDEDVSAYSDDVAQPMLRLNLAFEIAATAAVFLLVAYWIRRRHLARHTRPPYPGLSEPSPLPRAAVIGLIAALFVWFNPPILLEAHAWPQWDVWLVPLYLLAMFYASTDWFFPAGVCLAIGALLKTQMLIVAPVFLLWPLFAGRFSEMLRVLAGFLVIIALVAGYWLVKGEAARIWIAGTVACAVCFAPWGYPKRLGVSWWIAAAVATGLVIWPWLNANTVQSIWIGLVLTAMILVAPWWIAKKTVPAWIALVLVAAIVASAFTFGAEWDWLNVGFVYGPKRFVEMASSATSNVPALMAQTYGWRLDQLLYEHDIERMAVHVTVTVRTLAITIYGVTLVLCAIGAAIHDRRNDSNLLIALIAPWVLLFTLLPQMHERFLIWAAAISAAGVAVSVGWSLLHILLTALSSLMILHYLLQSHANVAQETLQKIAPTHPGIAWMLLLIAGVYLYGAFFPRPRVFSPRRRAGSVA